MQRKTVQEYTMNTWNTYKENIIIEIHFEYEGIFKINFPN